MYNVIYLLINTFSTQITLNQILIEINVLYILSTI